MISENEFIVTLVNSYSGFSLEVDLNIPISGVTAIFGSSGAGKTSLLRAIAGFERPKYGQISFQGDIWQSDKIFIPPHRRPIGFVFQDPSLFPHLNVQQNLDYGWKRAKNAMGRVDYNHIIDLLDIGHLLNREVGNLSGGERQRIAMARALLLKPRLLLMDEPMASQDLARKREILGLLERLKAEFDIPLLYVSHNVDEVTRLADHMVILEKGKIDKQGPIAEILSHHRILNEICDEPFSLHFGTAMTPKASHHLTEVDLGDTLIRMPKQDVKDGQGIRLHLYAKDVSLTLNRPERTSILNILDCHIDRIDQPSPDGQCLIHLKLKKTRLMARISAYSLTELNLKQGQQVFAQIKAVSVMQ